MIQTFINDLSIWSDNTFGKDRDFKGPLNHLKLEIEEVIESEGKISEFIDCFMLLLDSFRKVGGNEEILLQGLKNKLDINKLRKWKKSNNDIYLHIE